MAIDIDNAVSVYLEPLPDKEQLPRLFAGAQERLRSGCELMLIQPQFAAVRGGIGDQLRATHHRERFRPADIDATTAPDGFLTEFAPELFRCALILGEVPLQVFENFPMLWI